MNINLNDLMHTKWEINALQDNQNLQILHPIVHKDKYAKENPKRQFPKKRSHEPNFAKKLSGGNTC